MPYSSMRARGGIEDAIGVLRERGLVDRLAKVGASDAGDLALGRAKGERGPSGILNELALAELFSATRDAVAGTRARGRSPLLVGGDCPVLLGALAALETPGLIMLDGHEDAWPPRNSPTGEGSDSELGVALGLVPDLPAPLDSWMPLLAPEDTVLLGPRDAAELGEAGIDSLVARVGLFLDDQEVAKLGATSVIETALQRLQAAEFWLHLDLDVLHTDHFAAVDYQQPGGLSWTEVEQLVEGALADPRCAGLSVVIYNPHLDPSRQDAHQLIDFLSQALQV